MKKATKELVTRLTRKYHTSDPCELMDYLGIEHFEVPLGHRLGCYMLIQRSKCIFINSDITSDVVHNIVCAHELGHAIQHPEIDSSYIGDFTIYSKTQIEVEANKFAAELLLPDDIKKEYEGMTIDQIAASLNVMPELVKLKY